MLVTQSDVLSGPTAQKLPRCISSGHQCTGFHSVALLRSAQQIAGYVRLTL